MNLRRGSFVLLLWAACGPAARDDGDVDGDAYVALTVVPSATSVTISNQVPVGVRVRATATTAAGDLHDVSDHVAWQLDPTWGVVDGDLTGADVTFTGDRTGLGTITAVLDDLVGDAEISVFARRVFVDPALPADIEARFETATPHPDLALELAYPAADVVVPPNLAEFEIHTYHVPDRAYYRTQVSGAFRQLELFTPATPAANQITTLSSDSWSFVASDARDGEVQVDVDALAEASTLVLRASPRTVRISRDDLDGGLYFFAVDEVAELASLRRLDVGRPDAIAEEFVDTSALGATCVGCHAVSRDGRKIAMVLDAPHGEAAVLDLATMTATPLDAALATTFMAFSPDGDRLVATRASGELSVIDTATGAVLADLDTGGQRATHPDWSPAGDAIVWTTYEDELAQRMRFAGGGDLWVTPIDPATLTSSAPVQLTVAAPPSRAYYPSFSPDGAWILFNRSDEDTFDDYTARVWVVAADGTTPPAQLGTSSFEGDSPLSGPRWAPMTTTADGGEPLFWFTVSTREAWGARPWTFTPQLWMAAFFPARVGAAGDAAAPLFHVPAQGDRNNHFAQWTTRIVDVD